MNDKPLTFFLGGALAAAILAVLVVAFSSTNERFGEAPSGIAATFATSSAYVAGTTENRLFATTTACTARLVTTTSQGVMITFSEKNAIVPTATIGHWQAASTSINYDAGVYGCDSWRVFGGGGGNSNLTVAEFR